MMRLTLAAVAVMTLAFSPWMAQPAEAQSEVLRELYGRGVHAYYAGDYAEAYDLLSQAINNGIQDPRAYYFRGVVAETTGRPEQAEEDWRTGAALEARARVAAPVGRSLARIQGPMRLELETIRRQARVDAMAEANSRSKARYGEIRQAENRVLRQPPKPIEPPPMPPATDTDNPFRDDLVQGEPKVDSDDALEGAMENPLAEQVNQPAAAAPAAQGGQSGEAADSADPFGGGGGADPFGSSGGDASDPFGAAGGGGGGGSDDPFGAAGGDDPFAN